MFQSLRELLVHVAQCNSPSCQFLNCRKLKVLFAHELQCSKHASGGCLQCKKLWYLLQHHARNCKNQDCVVLHCRILRKLMMRKLQHQVDSRHPAALMGMMRLQATKAHGVNPNLDNNFNVGGGKERVDCEILKEANDAKERQGENDVRSSHVVRKAQSSTSSSESSWEEAKKDDVTSPVEKLAGDIVDEVSKIKGLEREEVFKACEWLMENENKFYLLKKLTPPDKKAYLLSRMN